MDVPRHRTSLAASVVAALCLLAGCQDGSAPEPQTQSPTPSSLQAAYISRTPRIPSPALGDTAPGAGWPLAGAPVEWVAHLHNRGSQTVPAVPWRWRVDGVEVASGMVDLPPGASTISLRRAWTFTRERLSFTLDVPAALSDVNAADNEVAVWSDGLTVGFWVEQRIHDMLARDGRPGFERWAFDQIERFNAMLGQGWYPDLTPSRIVDRLRLDRITVVPNGSEYPRDIDTDLEWYFSDLTTDGRFLQSTSPSTVIADQTIVLHELLHYRGLKDLYAYEILHGTPNGSVVAVAEGGTPVAGTPLMPVSGGRVFRPTYNGLMGWNLRFGAPITEHSAYGLNLRAGMRATRGTDRHGNVILGLIDGGYVNIVPEETRVRFVAAATGSGLGGATVEVFFDRGHSYTDVFAADPDLVLAADSTGEVTLSRATLLAGVTAQVSRSWTLIVRVRHGARRAYVFIPGTDVNLPAFRGEVRPLLSIPVELQ